VAIAVARIALRGSLPKATIEIRYTRDGTTPSARSPLYAEPFPIDDEMTIRAAVFRDGKQVLTLSSSFRHIDPTITSDPRWATDSAKDPAERKRYP
jgi:hypothetical protein